MKNLSRESLDRISIILLVLVSIFFTLSIALAGYLLYNYGEIKQLKASLKSQDELQTELFETASGDQAFYPHTLREIGFIFNPYLKHATWMGHEGETYPVNSLGLRGEEIPREKKKGKTRILIVGDSMVFGWKLKEEDKLSGVLNKICADRLGRDKFEFFTAALPGWNIKSEATFLESHLERLKPDFIIWSVAANDGEDAGGAVPPGILGNWNSPQKKKQVPFFFMQKFYKTLPIPAVLERWQENIRIIDAFVSKYDTSIMLLYWSPKQRPFFQLINSRFHFKKYPSVRVPRELLADKSWRVSPNDGHPSPWATEQIALGVLRKLKRLKIIPGIAFQPGESETLGYFAKEEQKVYSEEEVERHFAALFKKIPSKYAGDDNESRKSILYGVRNGQMGKNGVLCLRDENNSNNLRVTFEIPGTVKYKRNVDFILRNGSGDSERLFMEIDSRFMEAVIPLPGSGGSGAVYELSWEFDFLDCVTPRYCRCGNLIRAEFER